MATAVQCMCHSASHPVQVLIDERLAENAEAMGQLLRSELQDLASHTDRVKLVRGKGLLNAVVIAEHDGVSAWDVCMRLKDNGILVSFPTFALVDIDIHSVQALRRSYLRPRCRQCDSATLRTVSAAR